MKTILIIDDETQTRNIFVKCLELEGFRAIGAQNGATGLEIAVLHQPDLIVCDILMPDMDGYSVLLALRQNLHTASIPLVFLTAKVTMTDLRRGMELGADDYLTKPCSIEQFLATIEARLRRQEAIERLYLRRYSDMSPGRQERTGESCDSHSFFPDCPQLDSVFNFIEAHYRQPIQLDDVAQQAGYSSAYLTTIMKEQTGYTVKQWIIERRMAEARCLLMNTCSSIRQISQEVGYGDAGYFTRHFRKIHGVSPQAWRQESVSEATN